MTEFHIKAIIRKKTLQRNLAFKESQVQLTRSSIIEVVTVLLLLLLLGSGE
jgi:hypothetical protein